MIKEFYYSEITKILHAINNSQNENILLAANAVAKTIKNDGIIYIFGCGHSHLIALDCFYRAGGLANVSPILDVDLMLHDGAAKSSAMEKMSGIVEKTMKRYCISKKDVFICVSTSGGNAAPIEAINYAKNKGITTIAITSMNYAAKKSQHISRVADIVVDNGVPCGDAVIELPGQLAKMGSVSTCASSFIAQSILLEAADQCACEGEKIPIYKSDNIDGGTEYNKALIDRYLPRVKNL